MKITKRLLKKLIKEQHFIGSLGGPSPLSFKELENKIIKKYFRGYQILTMDNTENFHKILDHYRNLSKNWEIIYESESGQQIIQISPNKKTIIGEYVTRIGLFPVIFIGYK